jgi:hypothetical protein
VWSCPLCGAQNSLVREVCPRCRYWRTSPYTSVRDRPAEGWAGDGEARSTRLEAGDVRITRDWLGLGLRVFWSGVAASLLFVLGALAGWHWATAPVRTTVASLNALERQILASGGPMPASGPVALGAPVGGLPWPTQAVTVAGRTISIPAGWQVADTTVDYNTLQQDATDAITVQRLQERALPGGGFIAWGSGVAGPYCQIEWALGPHRNRVVVAVPAGAE